MHFSIIILDFSVFSMCSMCFCVCEHQVPINVLVCQYLGMRFGRGMQLLGSLQFIVATVRETHHHNLNGNKCNICNNIKTIP